MIYNLTFILLLAPSLLSILEGCGRIPTKPKPTTPPPVLPTQPTVNGSVRALECKEHEAQETACLNGGTCYVLVIQSKRVAECHCTKKYMGKRCQELNIDMFFPVTEGDDHLATAGIAASAAVLILIVIVGVGVVIVYRRRKNDMEPKVNNRRNGACFGDIQTPIKDRRYNGKDKHFESEDFESILVTTSV